MPHNSLRPLVAALLVACLAVVGCSGTSADDSLDSAKTHLAKNDLSAAIIALKNALQSKPDLAEARYLLGKALLEREDAVAATVELRKASDLSFPADEVIPLLAAAYLRSGQARKVVELDAASALSLPNAVAAFKTHVARAHAALGNPEKTEAALTQALKASANHAPALLMRSQLLAAKGDLDGAQRIVNAVLASTPAHPEALVVKAGLLLAANDSTAATALYRKALAVKPDLVAAHVGLLDQLLAAKDLAAARLQLDALSNARPKHPETIYFEAWLASMNGDSKTATEFTQQLLKVVAPDNPRALQLAGTVAAQRGQWALAEQYLGKLLQLAPHRVASRQLLARVQLSAGEVSKSLETLRPILEAATPDADSLALAGTAYLQLRDARRAEDAFARAARLKPDDVSKRVALAASRIARGDVAAGLRELESVGSTHPDTAADMLLISVHLNQRNYPAALKVIDRLQAKQPGKALPLQLRGQVLANRGDIAGARANYEKAFKADAGFFPAVDGMAALDLQENEPERARARFEAVLKANPNDTRAIVALAVLDERAGKPKQDVEARLTKAIAIKPEDPALRRALVMHHVGKQDYKPGLAAAQNAVAALPNNVDMLALLAGTQLAAGDTNQAISSYNKVIAARPKSPEPLLALAKAQLLARSYDAAADAVNKALVLAPDSLAATQMAVEVDVRAGKHNQALAKARALQTRAPKHPQGWVLEGGVELARRNWPAAAVAYRIALQKGESTTVAEGLYLALRNAGDKTKAESFAVDWLKKHPQDLAFLFYRAGWAINEKDYESAATTLEQALRSAPDSPTALNNLAWVQAALKKPGAVANAERANQLKPNQPVYMDTLAYALAAEGKVARAVEVQKRALELAPSAHGLRLNMARLYLQSGDKAAARAELDTLAKLGDTFAGQSQVRDLQSKL